MSKILFGAVFVAFATMATANSALADAGCRAAGDNPMVSREGFGIATCHVRGPRYFTGAYLGEGARGYVRHRASDPMVWSDSKWRSRLFGGYARTYNDKYDRRFRRTAAAAVRHVEPRLERVIVTSVTRIETTSVQPRKPRGPKTVHLRTLDGADMMENSSNFVGHRCRGILVLTWRAGGARSRCFDSQTRIRAPL